MSRCRHFIALFSAATLIITLASCVDPGVPCNGVSALVAMPFFVFYGQHPLKYDPVSNGNISLDAACIIDKYISKHFA